MRGLITWDKAVFDGEKRLLPNSKILYTQIYIPEKKEGWSIVFNLKKSARDQGYRTIVDEVQFLSKEAPCELLKEGYKFDFMDGAKKVGDCVLINNKSIDIGSILDRIELLEIEKLDFKKFISSIKNDVIESTDVSLKKLVKHSDDYPYLFSLVLKVNKEIALDYLNNSIKNNAVNHSNLSLFFFDIDKHLGRQIFTTFINSLPKDLNEEAIVKSAIEEIL